MVMTYVQRSIIFMYKTSSCSTELFISAFFILLPFYDACRMCICFNFTGMAVNKIFGQVHIKFTEKYLH
jgi:hypothetical protein